MHSKEEIGRHVATHPQCPICETPVYEDNEMVAHMVAFHLVCQPCLSGGVTTPFSNADDLRQHLRQVTLQNPANTPPTPS